MVCKICKTRKPRRYCPGVHGDICSICCGTEREVTVSCPLECEYLEDARKHDKPVPVQPDNFPNQDIRVTDKFIREHDTLVILLGRAVLQAALATSGAVDSDVREALEALIRTYRTLESGLVYETRPDNPIAAQVSALIQNAVAEFRREETERTGMVRTRDAEILGVLAFLQRLEIDRNNGRKKGRAYVDFLRAYFPAPVDSPVSTASSSLIVP